MISKSDWQKGLLAWQNLVKQAEIDKEQGELYINVIKEKIASMPEETKDLNNSDTPN